MTRQDAFRQYGEELLEAKGLSPALIGICLDPVGVTPRLVYDEAKVIRMLIDRGMNQFDARNFFDTEILGNWMGDHTPIFVTLFEK